MKKLQLILFCIATEILLIVFVALANFRPTPLRYFLYYNLLYGFAFSFLVPLWFSRRCGEGIDSFGIKKLGVRQIAVLAAFVAFSVCGQLFPKIASGEEIAWSVLPKGIVPLVMTTFFEEFLFRAFMQIHVEKLFSKNGRGGWPLAILISAAMFALYHLGYPGFRTAGDIGLLFFVGLGFAAAFKLSGNNFVVAYFVNLPNAFVTYVLNYEQFPAMELSATIAAAITIAGVAELFSHFFSIRHV